MSTLLTIFVLILILILINGLSLYFTKVLSENLPLKPVSAVDTSVTPAAMPAAAVTQAAPVSTVETFIPLETDEVLTYLESNDLIRFPKHSDYKYINDQNVQQGSYGNVPLVILKNKLTNEQLADPLYHQSSAIYL